MRRFAGLIWIPMIASWTWGAEGRFEILAPMTISSSGSYILRANLTSNLGPAITINASNVLLDLNGFTVRTTAAASAAIRNLGANVTIRDGRIYGMDHGVFSLGRGELRLHDLVIQITPPSGMANIEVKNATYLEVQRCVLNNTWINSNFGIWVSTAPPQVTVARIEDNTVIGFENDGIRLEQAENSVVRRNVVQGSFAAGGSCIDVQGSGAIVEQNILRTMDTEAIQVRGDGAIVRDNVSDDCLGGIAVADHSLVAGNVVQGFSLSSRLMEAGSFTCLEDNVLTGSGTTCGMVLPATTTGSAYRLNLYRNNVGGGVCDLGVGNTDAGNNLP
jgi:nitrous oxidase accessory protein NosD